MRIILFCLAMFAASMASADSLADATKLLEAKSYFPAVQMLSKLADSGDADAQLRLGEMYWYGEGVAVDRDRGDALFAKAAASGSKAAIAANELSRKREQQKDEIAYWTAKYDGADLRSGKFNCAVPVFPAVSTTNADIKLNSNKADAWLQCYNGFVDNVAAALPPGKRIPAGVLVVMSDSEVEQAKIHLDKVYANVLAAAKAEANVTVAQRDAWTKATMDYATEVNNKVYVVTRQARLVMEMIARKMN